MHVLMFFESNARTAKLQYIKCEKLEFVLCHILVIFITFLGFPKNMNMKTRNQEKHENTSKKRIQ